MIIIEKIGDTINHIFSYIECMCPIKQIVDESNENTYFLMIDRRSLNVFVNDISYKSNSILHKNCIILCKTPEKSMVYDQLQKNSRAPYHKKRDKSYYFDCSDNTLRSALNDVIVYKIRNEKLEELVCLFGVFKLMKNVS